MVANRESFVEEQGMNIGQRQHRRERQQRERQRCFPCAIMRASIPRALVDPTLWPPLSTLCSQQRLAAQVTFLTAG